MGKFNIGDRVILKSLGSYDNSPSNPLYGSRFSCVGTINDDDYPYGVSWDNGKNNTGYGPGNGSSSWKVDGKEN